MSTYMYFYIRCGDRLMPIECALRSSKIFEAFRCAAPYEKVRPITREELRAIRENMECRIDKVRDRTKQTKRRIQLIPSFNNSADEKLSLINDEEIQLEDEKSDLEDLQHALEFIWFLHNIVYNAEDAAEDIPGLDPAQYIYIGIETGWTPKFENS